MSYLDPSILASYEFSATAVGRDVDATLWDMMLAENLIFNMVPRGTTKQKKFEWEYSKANPQYITSLNVASGITGSGTNTKIKMSAADFALMQPGTLLVNDTQASLIGSTYAQQNEVLRVSAVAAADNVTVVRDYGAANSGTGYASHADNDKFRILYTPLSEGSLASASPNKWVLVGEASNRVVTLDFKLEATGDVLAQGMEVAADNLQTQFENRMIELRNQIAGNLLYGHVKTGSDSVLPDASGLAEFIQQSGGNVDYSTTSVTPTALNALFAQIRLNGGSQSDPYAIITHPQTAQAISAFGEDKVRLSQEQTRYGRQIKEYMSDLGFVAPIVDEPICSKSHLFIVNRRKWQLLVFRPFVTWKWGAYTPNPNGDDAYHQRTLGSMGLKVVDGTTAHGMMSNLAW